MKFQNSTIILFVFLFLAFYSPKGTSGNEKPNFVFLLTDDQATATVGCYGNKSVITPNLDNLAKDGIVFDRHYVTTSICMASRANIFTGLYEFRTGCNFTRGNMLSQHWENSYPMILRANGYRTAFAGKFGIEIEGREGLPEEDFDSWGGGPGQTSYQTTKNKSMEKYADEFPHSTLSYSKFADDFITESASAKKPFCLSISFKASHRPVTPDPKFDGVYKNAQFPKPANYGRNAGLHLAEQSRTGRQYPRFKEWGYADNYNEVMKKYNQQIYAVDVALGRIRESLAKNGVAENTVIFFTSDNGFMCGSHGYGSKVIPYEESMRVPLIICDPRSGVTAKRCASLTGSIDLAPTMLDLAGLQQVPNVDGKSIAKLIRNPNESIRKSLSIMNFWGPKSTHFFGVVTDSWKYLYWYSQENEMAATEELFDLKSDPDELRNAVDNDHFLEKLNSMRDLYERHLYEVKQNSRNEDYRKYKDIFDRKQPWETKKALLKN